MSLHGSKSCRSLRCRSFGVALLLEASLLILGQQNQSQDQHDYGGFQKFRVPFHIGTVIMETPIS